MKFRSFNYYIREAVRGLIKNRLMSAASIVTVGACIFVVVAFLCIVANLDNMLQRFESSISITVWLDDKISIEQVAALRTTIQGMEHIKTIKYISPEDALAKFRGDLGDYSNILDGYSGKENPLTHEFNVEVDDIRYQYEVIDRLTALSDQGVSKVKHGLDIANILMTISSIVRIVSLVGILSLAIISVLIIMNTIKLTVNNRKTEINIMKYVGATDWFIRWPFVIEGLLIGFIGSLIPMVLCWYGYSRAVTAIMENFSAIDNMLVFMDRVSIFTLLFPIAVVLGMLMGIIGSVTSMRRYLKV